MPKDAVEKKLDALEALRLDPSSAMEPLCKALKDRNSFVVAKAAKLAAEFALGSLAADLAAVFDRLLSDPAKSDPQCRGKNAIATALRDLHFDGASVFLRGARHVQMEPVWGGQADAAGTLRGTCALALVACSLPRLEILQVLVDLLGGDSEKTVRIDAARAIAQLSGPDSLLLLRMKALSGDREPEVTGQCFLGLLDLSPEEYIPFVAGFLQNKNPEVRLEAAVALAECPRAEAVEILAAVWRDSGDHELRRAILLSLGGSRMEKAAEFLVSVAAEAGFDDAANAVRAIAKGRFPAEYRERVAETLRKRGDRRLEEILARERTTS